MKNILRFSAIAFTLLISGFRADAQAKLPVYSRALNPLIGITASNEPAIGSTYKIMDINGKVVMQGRIRNGATFFISTARLANGTYRFFADGLQLHRFSIDN